MKLSEAKKRIEALEAEVAKMKASPPVHQEFHYHYPKQQEYWGYPYPWGVPMWGTTSVGTASSGTAAYISASDMANASLTS